MPGKKTCVAAAEQTVGKIKLLTFFNTALLWLGTVSQASYF